MIATVLGRAWNTAADVEDPEALLPLMVRLAAPVPVMVRSVRMANSLSVSVMVWGPR